MAERMDHEKMRRASEPRRSPGSDKPETPEREPIPGEHDNTTAAPTQPDIVGTTGYGGDLPKVDSDPTLDEATKKETRWFGGGRIDKSM